MPTWTSWRISLRVRSQEFGWRPKPAKSGGHFGILRPLREERTWDQIAEPLPSDELRGLNPQNPDSPRDSGQLLVIHPTGNRPASFGCFAFVQLGPWAGLPPLRGGREPAVLRENGGATRPGTLCGRRPS